MSILTECDYCKLQAIRRSNGIHRTEYLYIHSNRHSIIPHIIGMQYFEETFRKNKEAKKM